ADRQDTAVSCSTSGPPGLGVGWMAQWPSDQRSASVCSTPVALSTKEPTAVQIRAAGQYTPIRFPPPVAGAGTARTLHPVLALAGAARHTATQTRAPAAARTGRNSRRARVRTERTARRLIIADLAIGVSRHMDRRLGVGGADDR